MERAVINHRLRDFADEVNDGYVVGTFTYTLKTIFNTITHFMIPGESSDSDDSDGDDHQPRRDHHPRRSPSPSDHDDGACATSTTTLVS